MAVVRQQVVPQLSLVEIMLAEVSALLAPLAAAIGYSTYKARQFEH
ncbi:alpha/beta hydrolase, partial [Rhizobium brockwellii]